MQGGALEQMQGLVQQAVAPDWHPLPQAVQRAAVCQDGVHALVFDVLMDKVSLSSHTAKSEPDTGCFLNMVFMREWPCVACFMHDVLCSGLP